MKRRLFVAGVLFAAVTASASLIDAQFDYTTAPGTNFSAIVIRGELTVTPVQAGNPTNGTLVVRASDGKGALAAERREVFPGGGTVGFEVGPVEPGATYAVAVEIRDAVGDLVMGSESSRQVVTARRYEDTWIHEDVLSFAGLASSTGDWRYRRSPILEAKTNSHSAAGASVQIETEFDSAVIFEATNAAPTAVHSSVREIGFEICSEKAGYNTSVPVYADSRPADLAGVTIACDDLGDGGNYLSVYNPDGVGSWRVLTDRPVELNHLYHVKVVITYPNPLRTSFGSIAYYLELGGGRYERIAYFEPKSRIPELTDGYRSRLRFVGGGYVKSVDGVCYDAHAAAVEASEYWTIEDAIREIGDTGRILEPLWYCTGTVPSGAGRFGVRDAREPAYLSLAWPIGYACEVTVEGDVRYYLFRISDRWVDWADERDVVQTGEYSWEVLSANGLAWLARASADRELRGKYTLAADIPNLAEHVWTPIRNFSGIFEGNNRTITGLTDKGLEAAVTNANGQTVYALFGESNDSVFRNLVLEQVAISNSAEVVAALVGRGAGNLGVTNVVIRSGRIAGGGRFVAGVIGCADAFKAIGLKGNLNAAALQSFAHPSGGATVAGIAALGVDYGAGGSLAVVTNENRGAISSVVNAGTVGGNVAQILAGSDFSAKFDPEALKVSDNIGTGDVAQVTVINHVGGTLDSLPVVNLAAAVARQANGEDYRRYIEAQNPAERVIDPWLKTARMSSGYYVNGDVNVAGRINGLIETARPGETVTLTADAQIWSPVKLDRGIVLNLGGLVLDSVFDGYTFEVSPGANAVVRNGTVTYAKGKLANFTPGEHWTTSGVSAVEWTDNYWDRGILVDGEFIDGGLLSLKRALSAAAKISIPEGSAYSIDAGSGTIAYHGRQALSLGACGYRVREESSGGNTVYIVEVDETQLTVPEFNLALAPNGGVSKVVVNGARSDCEYCLQSVASLAESWDKETDEWVSPEENGGSLEFMVDTSAPSGFYRLKLRKKQ